jgi:hypothetical protein
VGFRVSSTSIDKFRTALVNGYSEGQAKALERFSLRDFMVFMSDVILPVGKDKVWVTKDGQIQKEHKAGLEVRKNNQNWY